MNFEVFMAAKIQVKVFWVVRLCSSAVSIFIQDGGVVP